MKILDLFYFYLFAFYYKDGNCKPSDNPSLRAGHLVSFTIVLWIVVAYIFYSYSVLGLKKTPDVWLWIILYLVIFFPLDYFYRTKKRYLQIYEQHKNMSDFNKQVGLIIAMVSFILPMVAVVLFGIMLKHR